MKKDFSTEPANLDESLANKNVSGERPGEQTTLGERPVTHTGSTLNERNIPEPPQKAPHLDSRDESEPLTHTPAIRPTGPGNALGKAIPGKDALKHRGGPQTTAGKDQSKRNAVKHGIFSNAILLKNESRSEFDSILNKLRDDLQPTGTLEEVLVEKLAVLVWRHRRLMIAEAAEIQKKTAFLAWDEKEQQEREANEASKEDLLDFGTEEVGLIQKMANPRILERCLDLLNELKGQFESNGFDSESDEEILSKLYGNSAHLVATVFDTYRTWSCTADCSDEERAEYGYASIEQCKSNFLADLDKEIRRLNEYRKVRASIDAKRIRLESRRQNVPDAPQSDRLLRYETHLERAFDRILTQLERLQRMRQGQPILPPIKVDVSS